MRSLTLLLAFVLVLEAKAELLPQPVSAGTYVRYTHPRITVGTAGDGGSEFLLAGEGRPGFEMAYGSFGLSVSGDFLNDPAGNLLRLSAPSHSEVVDVRTRYHGSTWGVEVHNLTARNFQESFGVGSAIRERMRPDLKLNALSTTVYRAIDPDSRVYRLSRGMTEPGGNVDVFLTSGVSHARLDSRDDFMTGLRDDDTRFYGINRTSLTSITMGAGYALTSNMLGLYFDQSLFGGWGPQFRTWGDRSDVGWNLAKANFRLSMGIRNRWFDVGVGVEDEVYASLVNSDRMMVHAMAAQAKVNVFL